MQGVGERGLANNCNLIHITKQSGMTYIFDEHLDEWSDDLFYSAKQNKTPQI